MLVNRILIGLLVASAWVSPALVRAQDSRLRDVMDREIKAGWDKEKLTLPARCPTPCFCGECISISLA